MDIKIKATNIDLTDSIREHVNTRVNALEKLIDPSDTSVLCSVEVEKTTDHHKNGEIYRAEINLHIAGHDFRSESTREKLFDAIDEVRNRTEKELRSNKSKEKYSIKKGGAKIKEMIRGFRN